MAATGCVFHRTLIRSGTGPNQGSSSSPVICRHFLSVVELQRYTRDQGSSIYFPQAVLSGEDLYDITLTDGDCRLRVTLDPGLNRQVERNVLRPGSTLRDAVFAVAMAAQLPECTGASAAGHSYRLLRAEVAPPTHHQDQDQDQDQDWDRLPWFRSADPAGSPVPLRASRSLFLPLWNNVDPSGDEWRETPPTEEEEEQEEEEEEGGGRRPSVTVSQLRQSFLSGRHGVAMGTVQHQLIVRVVRKSQLTFYGRADRNCDCPYKALLEVCDHTGSVCVVLWNSVCVAWYRCLKPGDIISLRRYRVKRRYQAQPDDIEISVNSRNPAARIVLLPESSVSPEHLPPAADYNFYTSQQLLDRPPAVCDVIGLLTFSGRSERIRSKDGKGAELMEYRWLRLEDGASSRPIMVKLFSTSQPECHRKLLPLSVVVCTNLKPIRVDSSSFLTNTTYTQVYCTGLGHHSQMSYRKLRPVQQFLRWLRRQDDGQVLSRALIGGFFSYPPPPVSLETFMKERRGEPGFLRGAELRLEMDRLCYRERRTFCIQATVTVVTYCLRGEEDRCLFWVDRASSLSPPSSSSSPAPHLSTPPPSPASSPFLPPLSSSTPRSSRPPPSSSSLSSSSAVSQLTPRRFRTSLKRKLPLGPPSKRRPLVTLEPQHNNQTVVLFEASMEFLDNVDAEDDEDDDEDDSSFVSAPLCPAVTPVAMETLAMRYDHTRREEQAAAVAMGGRAFPAGTFDSAPHDSYTLRLRALSDGVLLDAIFLPHAPPTTPPPPHSNTWTSILSHGAFSSHSPAPSPADLIATATQLANQKLVCILEACHLGGASTELVLSRAFPLSRTDA